MKNILKQIITILSFSLILTSCCKDDLNINLESRENYLIDKISKFEDSSNFTNTVFIYNNENKLVKKTTTGKFVENSQIRDMLYIDEFEYTNGLVSKIHINDLTHFTFSRDIHLFYNSQNQLIKQETWKNNIMINYQKFHYLNNKMVSVYNNNTQPFENNTFFHDNSGNVYKHTYILPKTDLIGNPIPGEFIEQNSTYEYDNKSKPNIGLDYLFVYTPLQGIGTETGFARELSNNNLTKYDNSGTTWTYKYNELGLPIQYEMKWEGIHTLNPMIWYITYKKIKYINH